ncbi:MAG: phosphatase PAP2 family protein [Cytophagales bacterium]|nr:MAG: phosphatase PAP2 family protein [Cytophagales bacterium]
MKKFLSNCIIACFSFALLLSGCKKDSDLPSSAEVATFEADLAHAYYQLEFRLIRQTSGFSPPVASRALGYTGVAFYESVVSGMPSYKSLSGKLNGLSDVPQPMKDTEYHWAISANHSLATILKNLFANASAANLAAIDSIKAVYNARYQATVSQDVFNRSANYGEQVANKIFDWSKTDGGHEGYLKNFPTSYVPPVGEGLWVKTGASTALQPYWGENRTFLAINASPSLLPLSPPIFSTDPSSPFYREGKEVYDVSKNLTASQREIALFWADDAGKTFTPPGHSISITRQVLIGKKSTMEAAAVAYLKVGIAVVDAFICGWKCKYKYNLMRPVTYVQKAIDPTWTPLLDTPPFPEYISGHSVQSGASAEVLTNLFGDNFQFVDNTHVDRGLAPRTLSSFYAFAQEAAISRLYGGIHFRSGNEEGLKLGTRIGKNINDLILK